MIPPKFRFDCFPADGATEKECNERGCCWNAAVELPGQPYCYFSAGFSFYEWEPPINTRFGLETVAVLCSGGSPYPRDVKKLLVQVYYEAEGTVRIKVSALQNRQLITPGVNPSRFLTLKSLDIR